MKVKPPKISVIIPTRERADVFEKTLKTVLNQKYEQLEIIVSDNYSRDGTRQIIEKIKDPRLKYINTEKRISMSHNWEFALGRVTGDWVSVIGDDDGLLPGAIELVAEIISSTNVDAITSSRCEYFWPGLYENPSGILYVPLSKGYEIRNSRQWLTKVLSGKKSYRDLPILYTGGFIKCSLIDEIKKENTFFRSAIPDVYSGFAIASVTENYLYIKQPLSIQGTSKHSNGEANCNARENRDTSESAPDKMFLSEDNIPFHESIPMSEDGNFPYSLHALEYESYLQTEFLRKKEDGFTIIDPADQLSLCLADYNVKKGDPNIWGETFAKIHHLNYPSIQKRAKFKKATKTFSDFVFWNIFEINNYLLTDKEELLKDVYLASLEAQKVLNANHSVGVNLLRYFLRKLRRVRTLRNMISTYLRKIYRKISVLPH